MHMSLFGQFVRWTWHVGRVRNLFVGYSQAANHYFSTEDPFYALQTPPPW
jgi:hypothetical protein